ncbi:MAG: hypothetical protein AB1592_18065 [Pseudomonadota bacterium]
MTRFALASLYGPLLWAAQFLLVYASESLACKFLGADAHRVLVLTASLAAALAVTILLLRQWRGDMHGTAASLGVGLAGLALVAIIWTALPALILPSCAAPT